MNKVILFICYFFGIVLYWNWASWGVRNGGVLSETALHFEALNILHLGTLTQDSGKRNNQHCRRLSKCSFFDKEATLVNGMLGERGTVLAPVIGSHNLAGVWRE